LAIGDETGAASSSSSAAATITIVVPLMAQIAQHVSVLETGKKQLKKVWDDLKMVQAKCKLSSADGRAL